MIYEMLSLQSEQNAIRRKNDEANQPLSWSQTRNMPLSSKVCSVIYKSSGITCFQNMGINSKKRKKQKKEKWTQDLVNLTRP